MFSYQTVDIIFSSSSSEGERVDIIFSSLSSEGERFFLCGDFYRKASENESIDRNSINKSSKRIHFKPNPE
jgi:hypothetical protein